MQQNNEQIINGINEWIQKHESDIQDMLPLKKSVNQLMESQEYDWERFTELIDEVEHLKEDLTSLRLNIVILHDYVRLLRKEIK